eukprot:TRINITY_DN36165_c0_g1_i1.p4 TRINITY_DN36165_c0_g1~~TRINITY_DN36165_c0_g1_i1.p4  ORF type:complete len:114 (+),score=4.62 TRINITY_DN36165_c0_g1_i1:90-431(+)
MFQIRATRQNLLKGCRPLGVQYQKEQNSYCNAVGVGGCGLVKMSCMLDGLREVQVIVKLMFALTVVWAVSIEIINNKIRIVTQQEQEDAGQLKCPVCQMDCGRFKQQLNQCSH